MGRHGRELEALQGMLEESHRMLAQVRDALEWERKERMKVERLLEYEKRRTQLLLDVLKHFKEKLQGLTPQMLLSRLGCSDPKALLAGAGLGTTGPSAGVPATTLQSGALAPGSVVGKPLSLGIASTPAAAMSAATNLAACSPNSQTMARVPAAVHKDVRSRSDSFGPPPEILAELAKMDAAADPVRAAVADPLALRPLSAIGPSTSTVAQAPAVSGGNGLGSPRCSVAAFADGVATVDCSAKGTPSPAHSLEAPEPV